MRISYWSSDVCSSDLAHHQHQVQVFEDIVDGLDGGRGIERDARLLAERGDGLDGAMEVRPRLWMNGQYIGAGLGEVLEVAVDGRDTQVDVERLRAVRAQRLHDGGRWDKHRVGKEGVSLGRSRGSAELENKKTNIKIVKTEYN